MVQLVIHTAFIGDLLLSSALLKQIRLSWPSSKIVLVCRKGCGDLILSLGLADEVFEIDKRQPGAWRALREQFRVRGWMGGRLDGGGENGRGGYMGAQNNTRDGNMDAHDNIRGGRMDANDSIRDGHMDVHDSIRGGHIDAHENTREAIDNVFCPHESFTSARFVRSLRARRKIGFKKWWNFFAFDVRVKRPMQWSEPMRQLSLLAAVDERVAKEYARGRDKIPINLETRESVANWPVAVPDFASIFTPPKEADVAATLAKFGLGGATGAEAGKLHHPLVFIAPGSVWATKRWTLDGFAAVTKHYLQRGFTVCLTGSPGERELCEQVVEKVGINENARGAERGSNRVEPLYAESDCVEPNRVELNHVEPDCVEPNRVELNHVEPGSGQPNHKVNLRGNTSNKTRLIDHTSRVDATQTVSDVKVRRLINLAGQTSLVELHRLFTCAHVVISNDSSPMQLAAMAGAPTVAIFGPTTLQLGFRPWNDRSTVAQRDMNCRPCGLHGHKVCPLGHHECMTKLDASEVIRLAEVVTARG